MGPTAATALGARRGWLDRAPQAARGHPANAAPARHRCSRPPGLLSMGRGGRDQVGGCHRQETRSSVSPRRLADHRCPHLPVCHFPYPGVASWVIFSWPLTHRPWPRPAWGKGVSPGSLQLRVMTGGSGRYHGRGRPLGLTPWPLARWQARGAAGASSEPTRRGPRR
jgi:hypothetical protein